MVTKERSTDAIVPSPLVGEGQGGGPSGGPGLGPTLRRRSTVANSLPTPTLPHKREGSAAQLAALYRLMAWLSPAYPVGAFSYSSGVEWAVETGDISSADTLRSWLSAVLEEGSVFVDAVLLVHAYQAADNLRMLREVAELAAAFVASKERHLETTAQGRAFVEITRTAWPCAALDRLVEVADNVITYPVAVGVASAGHGIPVGLALHGYLHAVAANLISAGIRLVPLGQSDGQRLLAALEGTITAVAQRAQATSLDQLGASTFRADLASMKHETQYTRLFRS